MIIRGKIISIESEFLEDYLTCGKKINDEILEIETTSQCYINIALKRFKLNKSRRNNGDKRILYNNKNDNIQIGVGTELTKLLSRIGITYSANCPCKDRALYMDKMGIKWCEDNIDIIVAWLSEEAERRKLPFYRTVAKLLVKRAIRKAKLPSEQANHSSL